MAAGASGAGGIHCGRGSMQSRGATEAACHSLEEPTGPAVPSLAQNLSTRQLGPLDQPPATKIRLAESFRSHLPNLSLGNGSGVNLRFSDPIRDPSTHMMVRAIRPCGDLRGMGWADREKEGPTVGQPPLALPWPLRCSVPELADDCGVRSVRVPRPHTPMQQPRAAARSTSAAATTHKRRSKHSHWPLRMYAACTLRSA